MKAKGFTVVELMIAVVIVAILVSVAFPSYVAYMNSSRRADAMSATAGLQMAQERLRANCPFYAQAMGVADTCGANAANTIVNYGATSSEGLYALSIVANSATGNAYTISADPQAAQTSDTDCDPMTIIFDAANPNGLKGPAGCWD